MPPACPVDRYVSRYKGTTATIVVLGRVRLKWKHGTIQAAAGLIGIDGVHPRFCDIAQVAE